MRRYLFHRFWESGLGFWRRGGDSAAWPVTASLTVGIAVQIGLAYLLTVWNRAMFDGLEQHDASRVLHQSIVFPLLAVAIVVAAVAVVWFRMTMQRRWRRWLARHVMDRWLADGRYYQLNLVHGDHENPEYRIAEDLRVATESPIDFAAGITHATGSAMTFIVVLWTIGGSLTIPLGGASITIPGFLVLAAAIYSLIASGSMVLIGGRFVVAAEKKNQAEAEFRYTLTRVRENGESIALLGGDDEERAGLDNSLRNVIRRWREVCLQTMRTSTVSQGSAALAPVIPLILCAPKYLDRSMSLGQVMQAASAFVTVQAAFNWLVENYPRFADWTASARRVSSLLVSLDRLQRASNGTGVGNIVRRDTETAALVLKDLSVTLDDGTQVIDQTEVSIAPGEHVLIAGESGSGKSTLVRAIAGLWPWGGGEIGIRSGAKLFFLPQRPYVPIGTLRRAVTYPTPASEVDDARVHEALEAVGLAAFVPRLDEDAPWDQILSGGEKQRLAFARLLLHEPDLIVMDEATSALDPPSQEMLMRLVAEKLDATTIVSVGHRPELEEFHDRKLVLGAQKDGAKLIKDEDLTRHGRSFFHRPWFLGGDDSPAEPDARANHRSDVDSVRGR
jgi:putative ATP-binding cassette transporter